MSGIIMGQKIKSIMIKDNGIATIVFDNHQVSDVKLDNCLQVYDGKKKYLSANANYIAFVSPVDEFTEYIPLINGVITDDKVYFPRRNVLLMFSKTSNNYVVNDNNFRIPEIVKNVKKYMHIYNYDLPDNDISQLCELEVISLCKYSLYENKAIYV